ncbi:MAG: type II secretion system F family protein [Candidatus Paceibacterota bacterium]
MSRFVYKAKRATGEIYRDERDAADRFELYRLIRESGDEIVSVEEKSGGKGLHLNMSIGSMFSGVKTIDKINFAKNLGLMLEAGLALSRALSVLERQAKKKVFKKILNDLIGDVSRGTTFADALGRHKKVFPPIFVSMVHAGEQSGSLSESLKAVGEQMNSSYELERRIRGAMIYPAVILGVMVLIAILMMIFVVPTLMKTFTDLGVPLPATTRFVLAVSSAVQHQGLLVLGGLAILVWGGWWLSKQPRGKRLFHRLILKLPIVGGLVQEVNTARTARTLSSLLSAGVNVVESMEITCDVVQNVYFRDVLKKAGEAIKKGDLMSKVFSVEDKYYPIFFAEMMNVGEETGKTGEMLINVARFYESDVAEKTKDMSTIIEPVLIVVIGAGVGFFAISMISPMYSLVNAIQ